MRHCESGGDEDERRGGGDGWLAEAATSHVDGRYVPHGRNMWGRIGLEQCLDETVIVVEG